MASTSGPPLWQQLQGAAGVVRQVRQGVSGSAAIESVAAPLRAGVQALAFHAWRNLGRAMALRDQLVQRAPPALTDALLCVTLALLWDPEEALYDEFTLVNQAVEALKRTPSSRAHANFVNACLRRYLRERDALNAVTDVDPQARWNHPTWWIQRLQIEYPNDWQSLLEAANAHAPMTLRVNLRRCSVAAYLEKLLEAGIQARVGQGAVLVLTQPVPVARLPGFAQGLVAVQDAAAQWAAPLLLEGLGDRPRILDACAAPGGKTAHLLEMSDASILAIDKDAQRLQKIHDNLTRLGLRAEVHQGDAGRPQDWWDGQWFDGILLDAPCTASGIVRRHPDIRWLRREEDVTQLARLQAQILRALWPLLRPGGRMVYCTCSLFSAEGTGQVDDFLRGHSDALTLPAPGQLLPGSRAAGLYDNPHHDHDGFFYALLEKRAV